MELVPEEKLVVITTEKPILSPSNENVEETLFPVDFDVDSSLEIEVTLTNTHQFVVPGEKYPQKIYDLSFGKYDLSRFSKMEKFISSGILSRQIN